MTNGLVAPEVRELIEATGRTVTDAWSGSVSIDAPDLREIVRWKDGQFSVERVKRGVSEGMALVTADRRALQAFLVLLHGPLLRQRSGHSRLRVPPASTAGEPVPVPSGREVVELGGGFTVRWSTGDGPAEARCCSRSDAHALAWAVGSDVTELIASFRDPDGCLS